MSDWKIPSCTTSNTCRNTPVSFVRVILTALLSTTSTRDDRFATFDVGFAANVSATLEGGSLARTDLFGWFDGLAASTNATVASVYDTAVDGGSTSFCDADASAVSALIEGTSSDDGRVLSTCVNGSEDGFIVTFVDIRNAA